MGEGSAGELKSAAEDVASSVEQLYRVGDAFLEKHADDRPYLILGAAAGVGFVLGGGLASGLSGTLLRVFGRMAVTRAVESWMSSNLAAEPPDAG